EEARNSIISGEINKLRSENSSSTKLSIGLGVVTIADLPEEGPKKEEK
ncbi:9852_t:CDS:2, partial [Racocetra persica]